MALSNDLISQFAKITQDKQETNKESTAYGKIVKQNDVEYVQLDGSDLLTPISSTTVVRDGDRVMVTIKNHTAIVTGDLTHPSASNEDVKEIGNKISEFEIVIADKVTTEQLEAEIAKIDKLITDEFTATNAKIETIEGKVAKIDTIEADVVEVNKKLTAHDAEFTTVKADIAQLGDVTADSIEALEGQFHNLESDYAAFEETYSNKITTNEANIKDLNAKKLDAETAKITYANIDFSNIGEAAVQKLFSESGIIKDLIMSDGKVTGELVGVTIKGDLIEGNTIKADKLVIKGADGIYYKLNVDALGETTASSDTKYQNGLDGSVIIAESITAEKIAVDDLVAFDATIGGYHIDAHSLYSGTKNSISNTTRGVFLGDDGQVAIGDANNYLKFYKDGNKYKLAIQAETIRFGASATTIEEAIGDVNTSINNINNNIGDINDDLTSINNNITSVNNDITDINKDITNINSDIDGVNTNIGNINTNITNINKDITNVNGRVDTLSDETIKGVYTYYLLQASTLPTPSKPIVYPPPAPWTSTEPNFENSINSAPTTVAEGDTSDEDELLTEQEATIDNIILALEGKASNGVVDVDDSLYTTTCIVYGNNSFVYSEVSKSSSYEVGKLGYNNSVSVQNTVAELEVTTDSIIQRVTTNETTIDTLNSNITETSTRVSSLETKTDGITASVTDIRSIEEANTNSIETLSNNLTTLTESVNLKMDSDSVDIAITSAIENGVKKVTTEKGFRFDEEGLTISTDTSEMSTNIDENGMEVKRGSDTQLKADGDGVTAYDLHAKTYLIVGENSRFEDYNKNGKKQTGCFWVGSTEVE